MDQILLLRLLLLWSASRANRGIGPQALTDRQTLEKAYLTDATIVVAAQRRRIQVQGTEQQFQNHKMTGCSEVYPGAYWCSPQLLRLAGRVGDTARMTQMVPWPAHCLA